MGREADRTPAIEIGARCHRQSRAKKPETRREEGERNKMRATLATTLLAAALAASLASAQEAKKSWTDALTMKGDARFRFQSSDEEGKAEQPRIRLRFRGRLSLDAKISDELKAGFRLVTNTGDPISDNVTMTDVFNDKPATFDRVFVQYAPLDGVTLIGGKMAQPWIAVSDLVFSADMNPEGAAARGALKLDDGIELKGTAGYFVIQERSTGPETSLLAGQVAAVLKPADKTTLTVGASLFAFDGVKGERLLHNATNAYGNTTSKAGTAPDDYLVYANDYQVVEGFARLELNPGIPISIGGQYAVNTEADEEDTGYLVELRLGKASDPGSFEIGYQYRRLDKDVTLGVFAESTDTGNGTNVEAHIPYVKYVISKRFDVKLQYAVATKDRVKGTDLDTFKADFSASF